MPRPQLRFVWNTPGWGTPGADYLVLAASTLTARLRDNLSRRGISATVAVSNDMREIGGQIFLDIAVESASYRTVEAALREELGKVASVEMTAAELTQAKRD